MSNQKKHEIDLNEFEKAVKYTTFGNLNYISIMPGTMVFDKRGKRRIGKNGRVYITQMDRVVYGSVKEYLVTKFVDGYAILKKI